MPRSEGFLATVRTRRLRSTAGQLFDSTWRMMPSPLQRRSGGFVRKLRGIELQSQSNEAEILDRLRQSFEVPPTFLEFGFGATEFNCASLVDVYSGVLIDSQADTVRAARRTMPSSVTVLESFLTLDNIDALLRRAGLHAPIGVLSVDVDGNDYYFVDHLAAQLRPTIIVVEYNASFGDRSLTVPYKPSFVRHEEHASGLYHGASLPALVALARRHGYRLVAVSESGVNGFFVRTELASEQWPEYDLRSRHGWRENRLRNDMHGTTSEAQWRQIEHLEFLQVS